MELLNLHLVNFRNFLSKKFVFDPKLAVIIGPNGSGKSNTLEAIALLSAIRIKHVESDLDFVKIGKSEAKIEGKVTGFEGQKVLTVNFVVVDERFVKKAVIIDDYKKRFIDLSEHLSIVIFEPSDLDLVTGSPSIRRHHLDYQLSSIDRQYWRNISSYNKIVTRRNKVLQRILEGNSKKPELDFWDARLLEHGRYVSREREAFFEYLNFVEKSMPISGLSDLSWNLKQSLLSEEKLIRNRDRDISAGVTLSGPHRDDFRFIYKGRDLEYFGSRGEQRMAVLALKIAELEYFRVKRLVRPILALDDIFSELDWDHRDAVLSIVDKQQTIISAAELESVPKKLLKKAKLIEL